MSSFEKTNIDEVPPIFGNVLIGQMSLVGPRPERPELIANFKEKHHALQCPAPGKTRPQRLCPGQWHEGENTDLSERVRYDLFYLEKLELVA